MWNDSLHCALELLKILYNLNKDRDNETGLIVPYETFYLRELPEYIDINDDYLRWISIEVLEVIF